MKKTLIIFLLISVISSLFSQSDKELTKKNSFFITPYVTFNSWAPSFGGNLEILITDRISLGGDLLLAYWSSGENDIRTYQILNPAASLSYHFPNIPVRWLDIFGGVKIGFYFHESAAKNNSKNSKTSSGLSFAPYTGLRLKISQRIFLFLSLNFSAIGEYTGAAFTTGLSFKVN
jgi:hypothetical protein